MQVDASNRDEMLIFTDKQQVYKTKVSEFEDTKASVLGAYLPSVLKMDENEKVIGMIIPENYEGNVLFAFENGKAAKVPLSVYVTKTNRRKLTGAYSDKAPLTAMLHLKDDKQIAMFSSDGRALVFNTALLTPKTTRSTQGVSVMSLKKRQSLVSVLPIEKTSIKNEARYRARAIPVAGALLRPEDTEDVQLVLDI